VLYISQKTSVFLLLADAPSLAVGRALLATASLPFLHIPYNIELVCQNHLLISSSTMPPPARFKLLAFAAVLFLIAFGLSHAFFSTRGTVKSYWHFRSTDLGPLARPIPWLAALVGERETWSILERLLRISASFLV
jgi:hypothetical protein